MTISNEIRVLLSDIKANADRKPVRLIGGKDYRVHLYIPSDNPKYFYIKEGYPFSPIEDIRIGKFPTKLWDKLIAQDKRRGFVDMEDLGAGKG